MSYVVYILTNKARGVLYVGVTNDLKRRVVEHRLGIIEGFTKKYSLSRLVYFEFFESVQDAIYREKRLKRWPREWKINLVEKNNPLWRDILSDNFGKIDRECVSYIYNVYLAAIAD
jgi:putative endonuclease